jgi:hypothetical protein
VTGERHIALNPGQAFRRVGAGSEVSQPLIHTDDKFRGLPAGPVHERRRYGQARPDNGVVVVVGRIDSVFRWPQQGLRRRNKLSRPVRERGGAA